MKSFARYARDRIKILGKSQKTVAEELGVSPAYISQIFSGKKNPPDLGKPKNRPQLRAWSVCLGVAEDDLLDLVRFELHRVPFRPEGRFLKTREILLKKLDPRVKKLAEEIRAMELHPAESRIIQLLVQIYAALGEECDEARAYGPVRFRDFCLRAATDREFVENTIVEFFGSYEFSWTWDAASNEVSIDSVSPEIGEGIARVRRILLDAPRLNGGGSVPVVGHVSAGEGFEYTDGGFHSGEGFEQVPLPLGLDPNLGSVLYCVRVRGNSLKEFFGDGALLFIKPESWEEVRDGDLVIFKERTDGKAFVKKVEFAGDSLILKSMNPLYNNMVLRRSELMLLERVMAIVL
jgi:SOS-response transcriptional repressor LexA/transcriptional regulator with XRE-family HTH domain